MEKVVHNLDISQYSLTDILELFNISSYDFSIDELKNAKDHIIIQAKETGFSIKGEQNYYEMILNGY